VQFWGALVGYPIGLLDMVSGIYYRDLTNDDNYVSLNWQRTYDNWTFHLAGFVNPEIVSTDETQIGGSGISGNGFQIMAVFNH
jgi:hemolysin activation/secretion protein